MRVCQFRHFGNASAPDGHRRDGNYTLILAALLALSNKGTMVVFCSTDCYCQKVAVLIVIVQRCGLN
jgi:hypothetical protein